MRGVVRASTGALTTAAMIAYPLARRRGSARRVLSNVVVGGLAATTTAGAVARWGPGRSALAASVVAIGTTAVEAVGTATGVPFGRYAYTGRLQPAVAGVPAAVPLAWWAMALPAREAAHAALDDRSTPARRVALGAAALAAWDLFLDPQMTAEGFWHWPGGGRYRGIPASNFVGWLLTGVAVMTVLERALPPAAPRGGAGLVGEYAGMAAMETVGFGAFFGDRLVAAVGGAAMLPLAALAVTRLVRRG
jgi:uncharacterized membrane protein